MSHAPNIPTSAAGSRLLLDTLIEMSSPRSNVLHPYCNECGWRKGGRDSWDGSKCKCGYSAPAIQLVPTKVLLRLSDRDVTGVIIGPGLMPGEVRVRWDDTDEVTHIERHRLEVVL